MPVLSKPIPTLVKICRLNLLSLFGYGCTASSLGSADSSALIVPVAVPERFPPECPRRPLSHHALPV